MDDLKKNSLLEEYLKVQNESEQYLLRESIQYSNKLSKHIAELYCSSIENKEQLEQLLLILVKSCIYGFIFNFNLAKELFPDQSSLDQIKHLLKKIINTILDDKND